MSCSEGNTSCVWGMPGQTDGQTPAQASKPRAPSTGRRRERELPVSASAALSPRLTNAPCEASKGGLLGEEGYELNPAQVACCGCADAWAPGARLPLKWEGAGESRPAPPGTAPAHPEAGGAAALLFAEQRCTSLYRPLAVPHHAPVYQLHLTGPLIPHVSPCHSKKATARIYLVPRYAPSSLLSDKVVSRVSVLFSLIPPLLTCWDKLLAAHLRTALVLFANGRKRLIEREHNGSDFCAAAWKLACDQRKVNNLPPDL